MDSEPNILRRLWCWLNTDGQHKFYYAIMWTADHSWWELATCCYCRREVSRRIA